MQLHVYWRCILYSTPKALHYSKQKASMTSRRHRQSPSCHLCPPVIDTRLYNFIPHKKNITGTTLNINTVKCKISLQLSEVNSSVSGNCQSWYTRTHEQTRQHNAISITSDRQCHEISTQSWIPYCACKGAGTFLLSPNLRSSDSTNCRAPSK